MAGLQCNGIRFLFISEGTTSAACESSILPRGKARITIKSRILYCCTTTRKWNIRCQRFVSTQLLQRKGRKLNTRMISRPSEFKRFAFVSTMELGSFEIMKILLKLSAWNYSNKKLIIKTESFHESLYLGKSIFPAFEWDTRIAEATTKPNNIFS